MNLFSQSLSLTFAEQSCAIVRTRFTPRRKRFRQFVDVFIICNTLRDLVPFVQFKKGRKHSWRSDTFRKVAGLLKVAFLHGYFSFLKMIQMVPKRLMSCVARFDTICTILKT